MTEATDSKNILFAGTTKNAASTLSHLVQSGYNVVGVLTRLDAPVGRKGILTESPVAIAASELGLPTLKANRLSTDTILGIAETGANLGVVVAYGALLPREALEVLQHGWLNLHFSLLPKYRGAAPVQHALLNGEKTTGVTIIKLDEGMDTGPILVREAVDVSASENAGELLARLTDIGNRLLVEALKSDLSPESFLAQSNVEASLAPKLSRREAQISFKGQSATQVIRLARGLNPEPMAWTLFREQPVRIIRIRESSETGISPGEVRKISSSVFIGCGDGGSVELIELQPAGKKAMNALSWFNGIQEASRIEFE